MLYEFLFYFDYARLNTVTFSAAATSRLTPPILLLPIPLLFNSKTELRPPRQAGLLSVSEH